MLRLTVLSQSSEEVALKIEGWISEENVGVLAEEAERWLREGVRLVLDLSGVRFIEDAGIGLLHRWHGDRVVLRDATPFVHALLEAHGLV